MIKGVSFLYVDTQPITKDQERFYNALFSNFNKYVEIRLIETGASKPKERFFLTFKELMNYPTPTDINVYIGIFQRSIKGKGTIESCNMTNAIYLDFDNMALDEIQYRIDNSRLPLPSMIVNSGHGYHVYWLLDKPAGKEIKPITDKLAELLKADTVATDTARVLRIPDTMNVKDDPVPCKLVELNDNRASVKQFERVLGIKLSVTNHFTVTGVIRELLDIKTNGLHNMAYGVKKGERNFCTGRIVQTLRRMNYTKQETTDIVMKWNRLNKPAKNTNEIKKDINAFWFNHNNTDRYRYDGKEFTNSRLQELNERFIDQEATFFKSDETDTHNYDNELLRPDNFQKTSGLTFAILSIIKLAEDRGIRREHIADLTKRDKTDKNIRKSLKVLQELKYIKIVKNNRVNHYVFTEKANYKRGYTAVGKSLHRLFLAKVLKEHEYKMMILLESYAYDNKKEVYPSNHELAYRLGRTDRRIRQILKWLEHNQFIRTEFKKGKRYIHLIYR